MGAIKGKKIKHGQFVLEKLKPTLAAVAGVILLWIVITQVFNSEVVAPGYGEQASSVVGVGSVILSTVFATIAGRVIFEVLKNKSSKGERVWLTIALFVTLLSSVGPLSGQGIDIEQRVLLISFHILVAAIFIPLTLKTNSQSRQQ